MAAFSSSSLAVSDSVSHKLPRHSSGLLKHLPTRKSKQEMTGKKMFGSRMGRHGKDFSIGKKFRGHGKGIMKHPGDMKSGGISPSVEEFDNMMSSISGKKKGFSRKMFG